MRRKKLTGFMGKSHFFLTVCIFALLMIIPWYPLQITFGQLKNNILLFIVCMAVMGGACLLPDLDNPSSTAGATLGPIGSIFTLFMRSTSSIVWNIYHFKGDPKPNTQHRYLWHTPIVGLGIIALFYFGLPKGDYTIFTNIKNSISAGQFGTFMMNNSVLVLFILLAFVSVLVGANMIVYTLSRLLPIPFFVKYIFPALVLVYIAIANYSDLRMIGICIGVGYLLHCIEDFFADTGIPLIWPIPKIWGTKKVWWRPWLPIRVTTGGTVNTIIDFVSIIAAVGLIIFVFIQK